MRDLVLAMAHAFVAEPHRDQKFVAYLRRPQLHVRSLVEAPGMVAPFLDAAFDGALQVDAPELVLSHLPRDDAKAQPPSRPGARQQVHARGERLIDERRLARGGPN